MRRVILLLLVIILCSATKKIDKELDSFRISCHTTDFECFKLQYRYLRDHVLLGNEKLGTYFQPYIFRYKGSGKCVKISGLEDSELAAIRLNSTSLEYSLTIELPFRVEELKRSYYCSDFETVRPYHGGFVVLIRRVGRTTHRTVVHRTNSTTTRYMLPEYNEIIVNNKYHRIMNRIAEWPEMEPLKKFTGNATIEIIYPYHLSKRKGYTYMTLKDENLDVIVDIPDLSLHRKDDELERVIYEMSEWAYAVVQNVDAAQHFALPYTTQLKRVMDRVPLYKFILLYPEQFYEKIHFMFSDSDVKCSNSEKVHK